MLQLEFSVMANDLALAQNLQPRLQAFEARHHIHVNLTAIPWSNGWTEISKFGIYGHGPDVSEIGTTWIGSLAAMQTLRPFTPSEVRAVGSSSAFFEANWQCGFLYGSDQPYAIPWLGDLLVLYYWKEALEKAGISDPQTAFAGHAAFVSTLEKLQAHGHPFPLTLTTIRQTRNLHEAVGWIWSAGGDLLSPDHKRVIFHEPAALNGWRRYFSLHRFVSPASLSAANAGDLFRPDQAVVAIAGPWQGIVGRKQNPDWETGLGIAPVPEKAYIGGSSLVIWQYSKHAAEAFELVRFLSTQPASLPGSPHSEELPTRREALNLPSVENDEFQRTFLQVLQAGRSFPTVRLWGMLEDRLTQEIHNIWGEIFANPGLDLDECLPRHFEPLAKRINASLGN
jgi:multiple sugar transport system substrate-binding protein